MKQQKNIFALVGGIALFLWGLSLASCTPTDGGINTVCPDCVTPPAPEFSCKIDGVPWSAKIMGGLVQNGVMTFWAQATDAAQSNVLDGVCITIRSAQAGQFSLNQANAAAKGAVAYLPTNGAAYTTSNDIAAGGTIYIRTLSPTDTLINGDFSSVRVQQSGTTEFKVLTEGLFRNIPYRTTSLREGNLCTIKIDNVVWNADNNARAYYDVDQLIVEAKDVSGRFLKLKMPQNATTSVQTFTPTGKYTLSYRPTNTAAAYTATTGSLTITEHDRKKRRLQGSIINVSATAQGVATPIALNNSTFDIHY